jgi:hypothetical protein
MSEAHEEALMMMVTTVVLLVVFVDGLRRRNSWRFAAPISIAMSLTLVWFNMHGYVFGGPGLRIYPPTGK